MRGHSLLASETLTAVPAQEASLASQGPSSEAVACLAVLSCRVDGLVDLLDMDHLKRLGSVEQRLDTLEGQVGCRRGEFVWGRGTVCMVPGKGLSGRCDACMWHGRASAYGGMSSSCGWGFCVGRRGPCVGYGLCVWGQDLSVWVGPLGAWPVCSGKGSSLW